MDINSVWDLKKVDGISDGLYRIIAFYSDLNIVVIYPLFQGRCKLNRPVCALLSNIEFSASKGESKISTFTVPVFQVLAEENLPTAMKEKRDSDFCLIKPLIDDPVFLIEIGSRKRSSRITSYAAEQKTYVNKLYRILSKYWC